jgi:large subunit ribosomal protein L21
MAYAIFKTGGKQYRVSEGDSIDVENIEAEVGEKTTFPEVLLVNDGTSTTIGAPFVNGASVDAEVVDQHRDKKVIAFKFKRRKGFHKTKGHRRHLTRLEIKKISG